MIGPVGVTKGRPIEEHARFKGLIVRTGLEKSINDIPDGEKNTSRDETKDAREFILRLRREITSGINKSVDGRSGIDRDTKTKAVVDVCGRIVAALDNSLNRVHHLIVKFHDGLEGGNDKVKDSLKGHKVGVVVVEACLEDLGTNDGTLEGSRQFGMSTEDGTKLEAFVVVQSFVRVKRSVAVPRAPGATPGTSRTAFRDFPHFNREDARGIGARNL